MCLPNKCVDGKYWNDTTNACEFCTPGCMRCVNDAGCEECMPKLNCSSGSVYIPGDDYCKLCGTQCKTCNATNATQCLDCFKGYDLADGLCASKNGDYCPDTTFKDLDGTCVKCPAKCKKCSSALSCDMCHATHTWDWDNTTCYYSCGSTCTTG